MSNQNCVLRVAVLVPCFNEAPTIARVVKDFAEALPDATIYVYDNNSTDETVAVARRAGAVIGRVAAQGKGRVVRRMFADVDADVYVLVDGDATYDSPSAPKLLARLTQDRLDMVVGTRVSSATEAYRPGHRTGNKLLTYAVSSMFRSTFTDMLSGYRVFSRRFVKSFPALSDGFEIETEFTVHALQLEIPSAEVPTPYHSRPTGSHSKLNTWSDGFRILRTIFRLYRLERPISFFSIAGAICFAVAAALATPVIVTYLEIGLVPRLPTAILAMGTTIAGMILFAMGFILDNVTRGRRETKTLAYLQWSVPTNQARPQ